MKDNLRNPALSIFWEQRSRYHFTLSQPESQGVALSKLSTVQCRERRDESPEVLFPEEMLTSVGFTTQLSIWACLPWGEAGVWLGMLGRGSWFPGFKQPWSACFCQWLRTKETPEERERARFVFLFVLLTF